VLGADSHDGWLFVDKAAQSKVAAALPHVTLYEGTKHTMATDTIRRGVPECALQRLLGHATVLSTGRYARLADHALIEVLRPAKPGWRQMEHRRGHLDARSIAIAVVHSENVNEVFANRVVDALGKAMEAGAKEGVAETLASQLVPREGLVDVDSKWERHRGRCRMRSRTCSQGEPPEGSASASASRRSRSSRSAFVIATSLPPTS
jgi:hypothetical protein